MQVSQILRTTADQELSAAGCEADGFLDGGQYWKGPWQGPRFFVQHFGENGMFVDEQQLRYILEEIARYRPLNPKNQC